MDVSVIDLPAVLALGIAAAGEGGMAADRDDITVLLARAFDQAWNGYYRLGRLVTISEDCCGLYRMAVL
jgi:hypothetical protein